MRIPPPGAPPPPRLGAGSREEEGKQTRAQQRAAGTKKTVLFEIVKVERRKRRIGNATLERNRVGGNAFGSSPRASLGASAGNVPACELPPYPSGASSFGTASGR